MLVISVLALLNAPSAVQDVLAIIGGGMVVGAVLILGAGSAKSSNGSH